jgi:hypothetical protein
VQTTAANGSIAFTRQLQVLRTRNALRRYGRAFTGEIVGEIRRATWAILVFILIVILLLKAFSSEVSAASDPRRRHPGSSALQSQAASLQLKLCDWQPSCWVEGEKRAQEKKHGTQIDIAEKMEWFVWSFEIVNL